MRVAELWRYPVKSMAGEPLREADVGRDGIAGDRVLRVEGERGLVTARAAPALLGLAATVDERGHPLVEGRPWDGEGAAAAVREAVGTEARLVDDRAVRFDESPLLVTTDGAVRAFGFDGRRLRPNLVIAGAPGLAEREWPGRRLRAGEAVIRVDHLCERCVITTVDPHTLEQDPDVLRSIRDRFDGRIALNCWVEEPGTVRTGDPVELLP